MYLQTSPIRMIARPKLSGIGEHVGVQLPSGHVAHKTPKGIEVVSLLEFAQGKPVLEIHQVSRSAQSTAMQRMFESMQSMQQYRLLDSNCEHFASYVLTGKAESRQANVLMFIGLAAVALQIFR